MFKKYQFLPFLNSCRSLLKEFVDISCVVQSIFVCISHNYRTEIFLQLTHERLQMQTSVHKLILLVCTHSSPHPYPSNAQTHIPKQIMLRIQNNHWIIAIIENGDGCYWKWWWLWYVLLHESVILITLPPRTFRKHMGSHNVNFNCFATKDLYLL